MSKTRGNAQILQLSPEQQDLLKQWLFSEQITYSAARSRCQSQFGLDVSVDALFRWRQKAEREQLEERALKAALARASQSASTASAQIAALDQLKDPFWAALMAQIGQDAFERRLNQQTLPDIETLKDLAEIAGFGLKARCDAEKLAQGREKLSQSDRRLKLLEKRDEETRAVVNNTLMTPEEKQERIRQILGTE